MANTPRRSAILDQIVTELKKINGAVTTQSRIRNPYTFKTNVYNNVHRGFKFLDQINDFPSICVFGGQETRTHIGGGIKFGTFTVEVRGYVWSEDNSLELSDNIIDDIELVLESIHRLAIADDDNLCILDIRILSISTDDGLMTPWGVADVTAEVSYQLDETIV